MSLRLLAIVSVLALGAFAQADPAAEEIGYLIETIGSSGCTFVRNGKSHSPEEAESHLRMKYRRAKKHARNAEQFIARLASKSSFSGKPYYMECEGESKQESRVWLTEKLQAYRKT